MPSQNPTAFFHSSGNCILKWLLEGRAQRRAAGLRKRYPNFPECLISWEVGFRNSLAWVELLGGRVVAAPSAHMQVLWILRGDDLDRTEASVGSKVLGHVGEQVLATQFVLDLGECIRHVV